MAAPARSAARLRSRLAPAIVPIEASPFPVLRNVHLLVDPFVLGKSALPTCMCTACMPGAHRAEKRALNPLALELQLVVRYHVGAGNETLVVCKNNNNS